MKKTRKVLLKLNTTQIKLVDNALKECARCWNDIVDKGNEFYKATGKWIYKFDLQKLLKHTYSIPYDSCCALAIKYNTARLIAAKMRKMGFYKIKYPYKHKEYMTLPLKIDSILKTEDGNLKLSLGAKKYLCLDFCLTNIKTAEIKRTFSEKYYLYYTEEYKNEKLHDDFIQRAGIDIGYNNCIAICQENGNALIINNNPAKSVKEFRNKSKGCISNKMKKCTYGSNRYNKLLKASEHISDNARNFLNDFYHKATNKVINYCLSNKIGELIIGDLKGIGLNSKKNGKIKYKLIRIFVSQMEYGKIIDYIKYKSKEHGIKVTLVKESYTSQICPRCQKINKPNGVEYKCSNCGLSEHRDCVGAFGILNKKYKIEYVGFNATYLEIK